MRPLLYHIVIGFLLLVNQGIAQEKLLWEKSIGFNGDDYIVAIAEGSDGKIYSLTNIQNDNSYDMLITCTNKAGVSVWSRVLGGNKTDFGSDILVTSSDKLMVLGYSNSTDLSNPNKGYTDVVLYTVSLEGEVLSLKSFGGSFIDESTSINQLANGDLLICASSRSSDGDLNSNAGQYDSWVIRTDQESNLIWSNSYGDTDEDFAHKVIELSNGTLVVLGTSFSSTGLFSENNGDADITLTWMSSMGQVNFIRSYGGQYSEKATDLKQMEDGKIVFAGSTFSYGFDVTTNNGGSDIWLVEVDIKNGDIVNEFSLGTEYNEYIAGFELEGNELVALASRKENINTESQDFWLFKFNFIEESITEEYLFGGSNYDRSDALLITSDKNIVMAGATLSNDGYVSSNSGKLDGWIASVSIDSFGDIESTSIHPNPTENKIYLNNLPDNSNITVLDLGGRLMMDNLDFNQYAASIDLGDLPQGVYLVKIESLQRNELIRIIKN